MLLTKEVEVKVNSYTVDYYKSLGYDIPMKKASESYYKKHKKEFVYDFSKTIIVKINDLQRGSNIKVEVLCDYCKTEVISMPYYNYLKHISFVEKCACDKCIGKKQADCNLLKYGVRSPSELDWVKEKVKNSNLIKYGVDNYGKTKECHEKMKNTIKSLYGVEHYSKTQEYKERFRNTCTDRYGESYGQQFTDKAFESFRSKTGYDYPSQSPEIREKIAQSCIEHYGVSNVAQSPEVREKMVKTLYANSSQKASRQQRYINNLYRGILNYPIKYYNVDICLPNDNLVVEYDGGGHMLNVVTGRETIEEYTHKEIIRNNVIKSEGYKQMKIISVDDLLPSDQILIEMLDYARNYFVQYPNHSWIEFNIDASFIRSAEYKDGIPYYYGELRIIK